MHCINFVTVMVETNSYNRISSRMVDRFFSGLSVWYTNTSSNSDDISVGQCSHPLPVHIGRIIIKQIEEVESLEKPECLNI